MGGLPSDGTRAAWPCGVGGPLPTQEGHQKAWLGAGLVCSLKGNMGLRS